MFRHLPPHPNIEYLKKQAKDLLRDLQQRDPASKLADAQHALAREYGFLSWPKLKAHVESLGLKAAPPGGAASSPEEANPFAGTWVADPAKSRQHPLNPFRSATLHFDVTGDTVTITDVVVDASGREARTTNTLVVDGKERPAGPGSGYRLVASRVGPRILEATAEKDGRVEGRVTYEVSTDGAVLTIASDEQLIVCDRRGLVT